LNGCPVPERITGIAITHKYLTKKGLRSGKAAVRIVKWTGEGKQIGSGKVDVGDSRNHGPEGRQEERMSERKKATLVLPSEGSELIDWSAAGQRDTRVIQVWNLNLLENSLHLAMSYLDVEVVRVIFDQSIDAERYLDFLATIPAGFRGDLLLISGEDRAYLSAVGRQDERVIYRLCREDLRFYLQVSGLVDEIDPTWMQTERARLLVAV
jgi:hypothetical protein